MRLVEGLGGKIMMTRKTKEIALGIALNAKTVAKNLKLTEIKTESIALLNAPLILGLVAPL